MYALGTIHVITYGPQECQQLNETQRHVCMESFTVGDEESPDIHNVTLFIFAADHIAGKSHFIKPKMNFWLQFDATQQAFEINCLFVERLARVAWVSPRQSHLSPTHYLSCPSSRSHCLSCSNSTFPTSAWRRHYPPLLLHRRRRPSCRRSSSPRPFSCEASFEGFA